MTAERVRVLTPEDLAWICAPLKAAVVDGTHVWTERRRCAHCHREIASGYLCRKCSRLEASEREVAERSFLYGGKR